MKTLDYRTPEPTTAVARPLALGSVSLLTSAGVAFCARGAVPAALRLATLDIRSALLVGVGLSISLAAATFLICQKWRLRALPLCAIALAASTFHAVWNLPQPRQTIFLLSLSDTAIPAERVPKALRRFRSPAEMLAHCPDVNSAAAHVGGRPGQIIIDLVGAKLAPSAIVLLGRPDDIRHRPPNASFLKSRVAHVAPDGSSCSATFDLSSIPRDGEWELVLTNPDGLPSLPLKVSLP
jgi:hypothetical protein